MSTVQSRDTAVIIPARNEAERIETCLTALAGQCSDRVTVIVVVNNTTDNTADIARQFAARHEFDLEVLDCVLPDNHGVGLARRMGCDHALRSMPRLKFIMTTDADCIVAPDWIAANIAHLTSADAVCGKVELIPGEAGILESINRKFAADEGTYRRLVQEVFVRYAKNSAGLQGTHAEAPGASLAFRKQAYLDVGGFHPVKTAEDRMIVRALRMKGYLVQHADDVTVQASCRLEGRAEKGMSYALKTRISGADFMVDDCLPAAARLVADAACGTLGVWPPMVAPGDCVNVRDLPENIERLTAFLNADRIAAHPVAALELVTEAAPSP